MPREILRITQETTFGTYNSGGAHTVVDLPSDNAFTMRVDPKFWETTSAAADNNIVRTGTAQSDIDGALMMYCRPAQAALLASMVDGVSGACPNLPSYTIDHGIFIDDGGCTAQYRRYLGCMFDGGFDLTNTDQGVLMLWKLTVMATTAAAIAVGDFPIPAFGAYDYAEDPFTFFNATGTITYGGVDISQYVESLSFAAGNILQSFRGASKYRTKVHYFGHRPTITMSTLYWTQQQRIDFEANAAKSLNITFTDSANDTLVLAFGNANYLRQVGDDLHIGDFHRQTIMLRNIIDSSTGTDMTITYTPHA